MRLVRFAGYCCNGVVCLALIIVVMQANASNEAGVPLLQPNEFTEISLCVEPMSWKVEKHWLRGNLKRPFALLTSLEPEIILATYLDDTGSLEAWQINNGDARRVLTSPQLQSPPAGWRWMPQAGVSAAGRPVLVQVGPTSRRGTGAGAKATIPVELKQLGLATGEMLPDAGCQVRVSPEIASQGLQIEGALPITGDEAGYLLVARFCQVYPTKWGLPIPDPQSFDKAGTVYMSGGTNSEFAQVERPGRSWVQRIAFSVPASGSIESAWVRRNGRDALCYSSLGPSHRWSKPQIVCSGRGSWAEFTDLSIARGQDVTCILWSWDEDGIYVADLRGQERPDIRKVAGWDGYDAQAAEGIGLLADAPSLELFSAPSGVVYAVWALNKRVERRYPDGETRHRIQVACRTDGQWQSPVTISEGPGIVRSPNIMVDDVGWAHVTYLRQVEKETFRCFYRRILSSRLLNR